MPAIPSIMALFPSFQPGPRLVDGGELLQQAQMLFGAVNGLVAKAGGGQSGATPLTAGLNRVDTVATAADSVMLPQAIQGRSVVVRNYTATSMQVFGQPTNPVTGVGDTIATSTSHAPAATGTGVAHAGDTTFVYRCYANGVWQQ